MEKNRFKYPRTPHLPWSSGNTDDDIVLLNTKHFEGKEVLVTEKLDGENTTMYMDYLHARSINNRSHISREWVRKDHVMTNEEHWMNKEIIPNLLAKNNL